MSQKVQFTTNTNYVLASGGDSIQTDTTNAVCRHIFYNSGTFTVTHSGTLSQILIVGGGGGGGLNVGGGGGGITYASGLNITPGTYNVVIGNGGNGYPDNTLSTASSFYNITAVGGESGIDTYQGGKSGPYISNGTIINNGVTGNNNIQAPYGAGGGGLAGNTPPIPTNGKGYDGIQYNMSGTSTYYGGGGGGSGSRRGYSGRGGAGGGGTGSYDGIPNIANGLANTGGGGGACGTSVNSAGTGGSGIVIIVYTISPNFSIKSNSNLYTQFSYSNADLGIWTDYIYPYAKNYTQFVNDPYKSVSQPTIGNSNQIRATSTGTSNQVRVNNITYWVHTFTAGSGFFIASNNYLFGGSNIIQGYIDILVVGGGGGGSSFNTFGNTVGNGGGGGQVIINYSYSLPISSNGITYNLQVGNGGSANNNGSLSIFNTIMQCNLTPIIANGGNSGTINIGGLSGSSNTGNLLYTNYINDTVIYGGAGGGGGGDPMQILNSYGFQATLTNGGNGGDGVQSDLNSGGYYQTYGSGGGGGFQIIPIPMNPSQYYGGNGGNNNVNNNNGGTYNNNTPTPRANSGSGGGGIGPNPGDTAASGADGIIVIRYIA